MENEDKLDESIAKLFDVVTETKTVNGKPMISDAQQIADLEAQQEMENAIADLLRSFKDFNDAMSRGVDPLDPVKSTHWWRCLEYLALAESRCKEAFILGDRRPASIRQWAKFRSKMLRGERYLCEA